MNNPLKEIPPDLEALADLFEHGALMASTDAAGFLEMITKEIIDLRKTVRILKRHTKYLSGLQKQVDELKKASCRSKRRMIHEQPHE